MTLVYNLDEGCGSHPCKRAIGLSIVLAFIQLNPKGRVSMKQIELTQRKVALVDDADYEWLNQFKWFAQQHRNTWYAGRHSHQIGSKKVNVKMHREILGLAPGAKGLSDHRDGNGLNNQRSNLRVCTAAENSQNRRPKKHTSSKFKGVSWDKGERKWVAYIQHQKKMMTLGYFKNEAEAARTYDKKAKELFGEFAWLNFPLEEK